MKYCLILCLVFSAFTTTNGDTVIVDAKKAGWQDGEILKANSTYVVIPDPSRKWSINVNDPAKVSYAGFAHLVSAAKTPIGTQDSVRLGSLTVLVFHHQKSGQPPVPEIFSFKKKQQNAIVRTGKHGGSIHFICVDITGTYGDNAGVVKVDVKKDDGTGKNITVALPITASRGSSTWKISKTGGVEGSIKYTVGSGAGSKKYASGVVVEFADGSTYSATMTATIGRPLSGTKKGTKSVPAPSIPLAKIRIVRRVYVTHDVESSIATVKQQVDNLLEILKDADRIYKELKKSDIVVDAVKIATAE